MIKKFLYALWLFLFLLGIFVSVKNTNFRNFLAMIENRTFDIRQNILIKENTKEPSEDIVIVAIDDASYEYILDRYGEWPMPREIYVKLVDYLEKYNPQSIAFDLMFVKSMKSNPKADKALVDMVKKYDNVFVSMNFDNQDKSIRKPPILPKNLSVNVYNKSPLVDFTGQTYSNCRTILEELLNSTGNVGLINVTRAEDGILRKMPVFLKYQGKYYPQLGMAVGLHYLKAHKQFAGKDFEIDTRSNLFLGRRKVYLDDDASVILNWYGTNQSYRYIPIYKIIQIINGEKEDQNLDLDGKIIYFGTTAASLFDIKTVPVSRTYPGVEVQATYVNNIIDDNFIRKFDRSFTVQLGVLLALITVLIVMNESSAFVGSLAAFSVYMLYVFATYYAMKYFNVWIDIVYPLLLAIATFIAAYIIKYLIKSRDFEQQYVLATTDGLTELYNHRYFQEQMRMMVEASKRYEVPFSLIILDIDFFKKFNDTFGHQAGDAVLRQVAQTLKKNVRTTDIACRYGGEEMSIILAKTDYETALSTAKKICERVSSKNFKLPNGKETTVTISLGASTFPQDGITAEELIEAADVRLYHAKNNGRNQVGA